MVKRLAVMCRGLPFSCTETQLRVFLGDRGIDRVDLPLRPDGRTVGEATVYFNNEADYEAAFKKDKQSLGHRYVEVFPADDGPPRRIRPARATTHERSQGWRRDGDRDAFVAPFTQKRRFEPYGGGLCLRLRGLPFECRESDVFDFFAPLPLLPDGVLLPDERRAAQNNGEGYVVFENARAAEEGLRYHRRRIGRRYIEIFEATHQDMVRFCQDNRLRVPRIPEANSTMRSSYPGNAPAPQGGYKATFADPYMDRLPQSQAPVYETIPSAYSGYDRSVPAVDPYSPRMDPYSGTPLTSSSDPYRRPAPTTDPYPPATTDVYGRPVDEYARYAAAAAEPAYPIQAPAIAEIDRYARPRSPIGDSYERSVGAAPVGPSSWRDDISRPAYPTTAPSWDGYGFGSDYGRSAGGPIKREREREREAWRDSSEYGRSDRGRDKEIGQRLKLKMRGIPFRATEDDVFDFFSPVRPSRVEILREPGGRPSGDARIEFDNRNDYDEALKKDKQYMGSRYVELFPDFSSR